MQVNYEFLEGMIRATKKKSSELEASSDEHGSDWDNSKDSPTLERKATHNASAPGVLGRDMSEDELPHVSGHLQSKLLLFDDLHSKQGAENLRSSFLKLAPNQMIGEDEFLALMHKLTDFTDWEILEAFDFFGMHMMIYPVSNVRQARFGLFGLG